MDYFNYRGDRLWAEDVDILAHVAQWGTPCYVYSRATLERHWRAFDNALSSIPHLVCYAVKANSNLAVLNVLARLGSGFDIVSVGELERVLAAGGDAAKVVFSGVGKRPDEIERALEVGIRCFNVESTAELALINDIASTHGTAAKVVITLVGKKEKAAPSARLPALTPLILLPWAWAVSSSTNKPCPRQYSTTWGNSGEITPPM